MLTSCRTDHAIAGFLNMLPNMNMLSFLTVI